MTNLGPSPMSFKSRASSIQKLRGMVRERMANGSSFDEIVRVGRCLQPTNPKDATSLVFKGSLMHNTVFGKIVWRKVNRKGGANTERKLMENELEGAVNCGLTPCMPLRYASIEIDYKTFMQTEMFRSVNGFMKEGGRRRPSDHTLHFMLMEDCGDTTLSSFLNSEGPATDIHAVIFMLFHALSWLRLMGISHNDLHGSNVILRTIEPTCVSFGNCKFVTSTLPYIIDWDLGRSNRVKNSNLVNYNHVGIFDSYNALFDTMGLTKTIFWTNRHARNPRCRAKSTEFGKVIRVLAKVFQPLTAKHPWIFNEDLVITGDDGKVDRLSTVEQTPYVPDLRTGRAQRKWPTSVARDAPTLHEITEAIYADADKTASHSTADFSFPPTALENQTSLRRSRSPPTPTPVTP